jgi:hypothetical protein
MLVGALVLSANSSATPLSPLKGGVAGQHVPGRYNGTWWLHTHFGSAPIYLPQRDKRITVYGQGDIHWFTELCRRLETLDSEWPEKTQLQKYQMVQEELGTDYGPYFACVNVEGDHGSWSILTHQVKVYLYGVWDGVSVQLVWSTEELTPTLRLDTKLWLYRFPTIVDSAVFLKTQALCSKWWRWRNSKVPGADLLRCFNALEIYLFGAGTKL